MADALGKVSINIFMSVFLFIFIYIAYFTLDKKDKISKLYIAMLLTNIVVLLLEILASLVEGEKGYHIHIILYASYMTIFILGVFLSFYWYLIMKKFFKPSSSKFKAIEFFLLIVQILNIVIILFTPFAKQIFYIDDNNIYHRSYGFYYQSLAVYYYPLLAFYTLIRERKKILKEDFIILSTAILMPFIGVILQFIYYGTLIIWSSTGIGLVLTYIFLKQKMVQYDALTGTWNRGSLFRYLEQRKKVNKKNLFGVLSFDLDGLKSINDIHGHNSGDYAIIAAVNIIRTVIGRNIITRMGGDEFIAVIDSKEVLELERIKSEINKQEELFNVNRKLPFEVKISIGYGVFDSDKIQFDEFIDSIDKLMYIDKNNRKKNREAD
ncbi:predicted diguanylate cyclase [Alteracholeplasma palmae J233]|uniref:Predicted diguanylate cyclase n=1 Tax=Alteracholeplasma palmae (strain ATCC 49389 / J233) TaxID=1318466 RepID=U4KLD1_ALTPJ|nr:GGDEF domain-containing protein [Alteracholeplasma palmae]CCV64608.1 predicted diguanylate cyclase [Alteracholeplasma palmae J233]